MKFTTWLTFSTKTVPQQWKKFEGAPHIMWANRLGDVTKCVHLRWPRSQTGGFNIFNQHRPAWRKRAPRDVWQAGMVSAKVKHVSWVESQLVFPGAAANWWTWEFLGLIRPNIFVRWSCPFTREISHSAELSPPMINVVFPCSRQHLQSLVLLLCGFTFFISTVRDISSMQWRAGGTLFTPPQPTLTSHHVSVQVPRNVTSHPDPPPHPGPTRPHPPSQTLTYAEKYQTLKTHLCLWGLRQ